MDPNTPTPHMVRVRIGLKEEVATRLAQALAAAGYPADTESFTRNSPVGDNHYAVRVQSRFTRHAAPWAEGYLAGNAAHEELLAAAKDVIDWYKHGADWRELVAITALEAAIAKAQGG